MSQFHERFASVVNALRCVGYDAHEASTIALKTVTPSPLDEEAVDLGCLYEMAESDCFEQTKIAQY